MKSLSSFISKITSTHSNSERRGLLKKYLQGKYDDYLEKLEMMCDDPKAKSLLDDAFGGNLGDAELKFSEELIPVKRLMPTQNEIGLESSLKHLLNKPDAIDMCFTTEVEIISPIITFNKNYVIDGHHRWSQIFCTNTNAKVVCINYDGDLSIIQMLKATQGAIAAAVDYVPKSVVKGNNLYKAKDKEIIEYIEENIVDDVVDKLIKYTDCNTKDDVIKYLLGNCNELVENHPLLHNAPNRELMPQTSKGNGLNPDGALDKLKRGNVLKV